MIRKPTKPISTQLREMKIGETFVINARAGIPIQTIQHTAKRLRKEGYDYKVSIVGLPKGSCSVTRIEPRPQLGRGSHDIVVLEAAAKDICSTRGATFEVDYAEDGEPKHTSFRVVYYKYEYFEKKMNEAGKEAAYSYLAKLIEDTLL